MLSSLVPAEVGFCRCDDRAGNAKDVCVKEAKAVEVRALADAKLGKQIGEARRKLPWTRTMPTTR
jgi:hypothetical protein